MSGCFDWVCSKCNAENLGTPMSYKTHCSKCGSYWADVKAHITNGEMVPLRPDIPRRSPLIFEIIYASAIILCSGLCILLLLVTQL